MWAKVDSAMERTVSTSAGRRPGKDGLVDFRKLVLEGNGVATFIQFNATVILVRSPPGAKPRTLTCRVVADALDRANYAAIGACSPPCTIILHCDLQMTVACFALPFGSACGSSIVPAGQWLWSEHLLLFPGVVLMYYPVPLLAYVLADLFHMKVRSPCCYSLAVVIRGREFLSTGVLSSLQLDFV